MEKKPRLKIVLWLAKKKRYLLVFLFKLKGGTHILKIKIWNFRIFYLRIRKFGIRNFRILVFRIRKFQIRKFRIWKFQIRKFRTFFDTFSQKKKSKSIINFSQPLLITARNKKYLRLYLTTRPWNRKKPHAMISLNNLALCFPQQTRQWWNIQF